MLVMHSIQPKHRNGKITGLVGDKIGRKCGPAMLLAVFSQRACITKVSTARLLGVSITRQAVSDPSSLACSRSFPASAPPSQHFYRRLGPLESTYLGSVVVIIVSKL